VAVTPGYQRCPKCHAALPSSVRMPRLADGGGGATTAAPVDEPASRWPWYLAGFAVLAGAVAVVVIGASGGKPAPELPDDPVVDDEVVEAAAGTGDEEAPAPAPPRPPDPAPAADRLARQMAGVRLYATVEPIGDTIEIRSASCDDARIAGLIAEVAPDLREAGVVTVTCRALHGAEAWTRPLP
jgi:hypothetical protein